MIKGLSPAIVVIPLLAILWLLHIYSVRFLSATYDEGGHLDYGRRMLALDSGRPTILYDSKMPFSALNAAPGKIGELLKDKRLPQKFLVFLGDFTTARYVTILFSLIVAFYVYSWSAQLYGQSAGTLSLLLYVFSPNIIAHAQLVTTDIYACGMIVIATYYFWKFMNFKNWKNATKSACALGLSQLAKYFCVFLYPLFALTALGVYVPRLFRILKHGDSKTLLHDVKVFSKFCVFFVIVSVFIINAGFLFNRSFTPLGKYDFQSSLFKGMQKKAWQHFYVPLPYPYLQGLDMVADLDATGASHANLYLLGRLHTRTHNNEIEPFRGYYFYAFLFKEPIATQLFILGAIVLYAVFRKRFVFFKNEIFLLLPVLLFSIYFNFFFKTQIGIRYFLMVFPLLYIFCGSLFSRWGDYGKKIKFAVISLFLYLVISAASYFPHYLSYFNEFVGDRRKAYKILADSNIDWGQSDWYLTQYIARHPDVAVSPGGIATGKIVVSVNELVGLYGPEKYRWLRENFEPVDHIAYSYLVYDITAAALRKDGLGGGPE